MTQFRHLSVGLYIVTFTGAHGKIHSPLGSMAEEPHIRRRRIAALDNPSTESDFSITCQMDRVIRIDSSQASFAGAQSTHLGHLLIV